MIRLLVLTCGTNANFHIVKVLKEKFGDAFQIVGADINKEWEIPCSPYLDYFYTSPWITDNNYYQFVLDLCKNCQIDYIIPCFDADQLLFYEGNPDLDEMGVKSLGINSRIKDIYQTKRKVNEFLYAKGFPVPRFFSFEEINKKNNYFVKPLDGYGSIGARIMSGESIDAKTASCNLIEEICSEPEITLECFLYGGKVFSVARQRLSQKNGVCTKARVFFDEGLTEIAQTLADSITLPHIFNLQFMFDSKGEFVITDLNLRAAGGMSLSYAAGWDEVSALANVLLGLSDEEVIKNVLPIRQEQYVMRAYTDIVTKKVEKRIAFDLDGTLLDSKDRHKIVMDDVLREFGIVLESDSLLAFKAEGHNNVDWLLSKGVDKDVSVAIQTKWMSLIERSDYLAKDNLFDGIKDILHELSKTNELFLITARNDEKNAREQINQFGISQYFSHIKIVSSDRNTYKAKATYLIENRIDEMVGDSETDYYAACKAKCSFYMLNYGFRSERYWSKLGVISFSDLNQINRMN